MPKLKNPTVKQLKSRLDKVFSEYIRLRDSENGLVICFTCLKRIPIKEAHAAHFVSRRHHATRWHPKNVHGSCISCNAFRGGALDEYALALIRKYGPGILEELNREKHTIKKWTKGELKALIEEYKQKLKEL